MGTIIINQTDCKQNVVLQSSLDGITGGYYDAAGVWHELGAFEFEPKDMQIGTISDAATSNYFATPAGSTRIGSPYFFTLPEGDYVLLTEPALTGVQGVLNFYNKAGMDEVLTHAAISAANRQSSGWKDLGETISVPDCYAVRVSLKNADDSTFDAVPFTKLTIKKK